MKHKHLGFVRQSVTQSEARASPGRQLQTVSYQRDCYVLVKERLSRLHWLAVLPWIQVLAISAQPEHRPENLGKV